MTRADLRSVFMSLAWLTAPLWLLPLGWWLAYQSWAILNYIGLMLLFSQLVLVFVAMAAGVVLAVGPIAVLFRAHRRRALILIAQALVFLPSFIGGLMLGHVVQHNGIVGVINRGDMIVVAIRKYTSEKGRPPDSLDELKSQYITTIPTTGYGVFPEFVYVVGNPALYDGNPWVLLATPPCVTGFDSLMYFPLQNYPAVGYGGGIERIGTWGYVHE